jgi:hypothetical protein
MIDDIVFCNQIRKVDEVKLHEWGSLDQIELVEIDLKMWREKKSYGMAKIFWRMWADFHISSFEIAVLTP